MNIYAQTETEREITGTPLCPTLLRGTAQYWMS